MRRPKSEVWKEYRGSLAVAYGVAVLFSFFMPAAMGPQHEAVPLATRVLIAFISGTFFGHAFFFAGFGLPRIRFRSFLLTCLVKSLAITGVMLVGLFILFPIFFALFAPVPAPPWDPEILRSFVHQFPTSVIFQWSLIGLGTSMVINAIHQINRKLGPGIIFNWVMGKYHNPQEEERVFMFLDLKNSTTLAEKLGNLRFSRLCQDFFKDLSDPVTITKGEVSHYIGDEAVLTWKPKNGLEKANCIRCFYLMEDALAARAAHYQKEYGIHPEFKAGIHIGLVVAAQVGEIKSEIVYHGDVLNTTARITGLCSELDSDLLISGDLLRRLVIPPELEATSLGMRLLKGKEHEVEIVRIAVAAKQPAPAPIREKVGRK